MNRALLPREFNPSVLLGYWDFDGEPLATVNNLTWSLGDRLRRTVANILLFCPTCTLRTPTITLGPSRAPIKSLSAPWIFHITKSVEVNLGPFSFLCLNNDTLTTVPCSYTGYNLDTLTVLTQTTAGLTTPAYGVPITTSMNISYEPFPFLLAANRGLDAFNWSISSSSSPGTPFGTANVRLYNPPNDNMVSPLNATNQVRAVIRVAPGNKPSVITLPCFSLVGAQPRPFIISAPKSAKLYQMATTLSSNGSFIIYPSNDQILNCDQSVSNYPWISPECYLQGNSQSVYYVPMADPSLPAPTDLFINYSCGLPEQYLMMNPVAVNISATSMVADNQLSFDPSSVGPNPFALYFDGAYTHAVTNTNDKPLEVAAISIWVRPDLNPVYDANATSYSETRTLVQLFPRSAGLTHQTEILLVRNASSYPNYFCVVNNYNTLDSSLPTGFLSLSSYAGNSSSPLAIEPSIWTNIIVTQSPASSSSSLIYIDGSRAAQGAFGTISPPSQIHFGTSAQFDPPVRSTSYMGSIDDFSLWSSPFTPYEALTLQFSSISTNNSDLVAYWDMNEGVGFSATDAVNSFILVPQSSFSDSNASTTSQAQAMPAWVWPVDLTFDLIVTSINSPQVITLDAYAGSPAENWKLGVYITNLPKNGILYQVPQNFTATSLADTTFKEVNFGLSRKKNADQNEFSYANELRLARDVKSMNLSDPNFIATLTPIKSAFAVSPSLSISFLWAKSVVGVSSSRAAPPGSSSWNATNILGAPSWWISTAENDTDDSSSSRFGSSSTNGWTQRSPSGSEDYDGQDDDAEEEGENEDGEGDNHFDRYEYERQKMLEEEMMRLRERLWKMEIEKQRALEQQQHQEKERYSQHKRPSGRHARGLSRQQSAFEFPLIPDRYAFPVARVVPPASENASSNRKITSIAASMQEEDDDTSSNLVSQNSPVYGENPRSWSPASDCAAAGNDLEYIELEFEAMLYISRVEIFQNLFSGAVTRIASWDYSAKTWRTLYSGSATEPRTVYTTFTPAISTYPSFRSNRIRIELDTCTYLGWYEIEAVRITGTKSLPEGVITDPLSRVIYVPSSSLPGTDSFTYSASSSPLGLSTASPSFSFDLQIGQVTPAPVVYTQTLDVQARDFTLIHLMATLSDSSSAAIQRVVSQLPERGTLYNAAQRGDGSFYPTSELTTNSTDIIISNADGYLFYKSPDVCKFQFSHFQYYATSQGERSSTATITVNSLCAPSYRNYARWLSVILLVLVILAIIAAALFGVYAFVERKQRAIEADRHQVLIAISVAACVSYASLFFEFAPATAGYCLAKLWMLHIGTTALVAAALALILIRWTDFSSQALRSANREASSIPIAALILASLVMAIEIIQLIIFSAIDMPYIKTITSQDNPAASVALCVAPRFPYTLLVINKAVWLVAVFVIACILLSVSTSGRSSYTFLLFSSVTGVVAGLAFIIAIYSTKSPAVILTLNVLALVIPISLFIGALFLAHIFYRRTNKIQNVVETTEFGLQPITSPKTAARNKANPQLTDTVANVQMTLDMNNHSVDKSVASLLDTVQIKEREIATLKRKLLKRHYKIRELQQKLTETNESSNMQMFGSGPPEYTE